MVQAGLLSDIVEAEFQFQKYKPILSHKQHVEVPSLGAGTLNNLGLHLIDQALRLFGMPDAIFADIRITQYAWVKAKTLCQSQFFNEPLN
ncbi:hypothetical protein [Nostoc sp. ChiQUE01b]|uniref:Gfo/Idh/MocA family protein n=1 Tax=Nostoc sp. ChiQUE01b TaxID=3075376 RepID=UPI003A0FBF67